MGVVAEIGLVSESDSSSKLSESKSLSLSAACYAWRRITLKEVPEGKILTDAGETDSGKSLKVKLYKGSLDATVDRIHKESD